ncbi:MAG TPA: response regulator [Verrucomicrobiae bacterium]|nr:response regulator [Verrucomicrobiae bacterium]
MTPAPILLVEDDENDIFFFTRAVQLTATDRPLQVVKDGMQAMEYLGGKGNFADRQKYPFPGVVILDLNLPRKPGLEVLKWIRQHTEWSGIPVVVLTSSSSDLDVTVAYRLGANSYFVKPTDPDALTDLLRVFQEYWFKWGRVLPVPSV